MNTIKNVATVARREFEVRMRTRSFVFGTLLLVIGVVAIALLPVIVRYIDRQDATRVAVVASADDLTTDPVATLTRLLNAPTTADADPQAEPDDRCGLRQGGDDHSAVRRGRVRRRRS